MPLDEYEEDHGIEPDDMSESEMLEIIEDALADGRIDRVAYGVAQQCLDRGYESLSVKQAHVYDKQVGPVLATEAVARKVQRILDSNPD